MIYLILPSGSSHGWGICGKYLVKELSELTSVKYVTEEFTLSDIGDEIEYSSLRTHLIGPDEVARISKGEQKKVEHPVLQAISNHQLTPWLVNLRGSITCGYTFFEVSHLAPQFVQNGKDHYDIIAAGSSWCKEVLSRHGLQNVTTIIQGIDPQLFNPSSNEKQFFKNHFVIFSGGKFEYRKGQDIVIKACKVMQDRHSDVILVNSWYNIWPDSMKSMALSPYVTIDIQPGDYLQMMNKIISDNGLDMHRVLTLLPRPNAQMARIYKNTDIGLFPNRCEGGTNLVLMEYMACGKPVIASYTSGHKDILTQNNSIPIRRMKPLNIPIGDATHSIWDDPNLEETIAHLEQAYQNRGNLLSIGRQAGEDLSKQTWKKMGEKFYALLTL